ncbi:bactericidal permeability-increasing protein-like [Hyla sarda]|uniref:bactericidal permeability-increasing protein-like n=1 Tax=Hyla sarda TaxID=327740 RepID=UPI0024C27584|nr:bactericidal permeability-increasing protein-like [Hyla sarda]XP_056406436.1 bactericidal permeability-increasing protein-like [Hyla sarda]
MAPGYTLTMALCVVLVGATYAGNPGFVVRVTQKGLEYAREQGMTVLRQKLSTIHLPDFSGSYDVGILGKVKYNIDSMVITNFQLPSSQVTLLPNVGMKLSISGAYIQIRGNWGVRYLFVSTSGDFELKVLGISISVGLSLGSDGSGRPTISTTECSAHISDMQVHFSGGLDWLINLFDDVIASSLKNTMEDQLCNKVNDAVKNQLEPVLRSLPVTAKIDDVAAIDYSLIGPPAVTSENLDAQLKGEFFDQSHRSSPPFSPQPLSLPDDHSLMVYLAASDYLFNTAGFVYQSAGKLIFNVTDDMIPKDFPVRLNTTSFGKMIPQISKMYPDMLMKLKISSPSAPSLAVEPGNVTISPVLDIQAYAVLPNSSLASLFLLNLSAHAVAKIGVNSSRIVGYLELSSIKIDLKHSDVGPFPVELLNFAVNYYVSHILLPRVNEILVHGYPLPLLDDVELFNVVLKLHEHYLLLGADVKYG